MAGHSKWANIKHRKGAQDAKRGKIFTKIIREIVTAARIGGGDPDGNPRLRLILEKARAANMPKDTIAKAIQRGVGGGDEDNFEEVMYEGYGPGGTAILVEGLTDNRNRTVGEVRHVFSKAGGNMGDPGCVAYLFEKQGQIVFDADGIDADALMEAALEAGADDIQEADDALTVVTSQGDFESVKKALESGGFAPTRAEIAMAPSTTVSLEEDDAEKMLKLVDAFEDLDDVQAVHANFDIPDEVLERLA